MQIPPMTRKGINKYETYAAISSSITESLVNGRGSSRFSGKFAQFCSSSYKSLGIRLKAAISVLVALTQGISLRKICRHKIQYDH